jgi:PAS domain S-box-containing protein
VEDTIYLTDIVIVDDDVEVVRLLTEWLSRQGYQVQAVSTGEAALSLLANHAPDLILLDMVLPDTDGYTLCQHIKTNPLTQDIPVICLTSLVGAKEQIQAFHIGASDYITKPFALEEVLARVQNQLRLAQQRQQLSQQNALLTQEVRERIQVEQSLRTAEMNYRSVFENSTVGIFKSSASGHYLSVNPSMARMYGYESPDDMMASIENISRQIYVQPKRWDELKVYLNRYEKITDAESEVTHSRGTTFWVSEDIWKVWDKAGNFLYYEGIAHDIQERRKMETELRQQRQQADRLLVNILPYQIAQRLKLGTRTIAESFSEVSVLFADLVDFTAASGGMTPRQLVKILNEIFSMFDQLAEFYQLEKIKTIGDAYMVAGGLPTAKPDHNEAIAQFALDILEAIKQFTRPDGQTFQLRIGINTGPVVAGVIGQRKFAYDLWGDTVNIASRMETTGEGQKIQVTPELYEILKEKFIFQKRGHVTVKGRGQMTTYWLLGKRPNVPDDSDLV